MPCVVQLLEQRHHFDGHAAVEISRRLVGEEQRRLRDQRSRDRHALLLTARQLARLVIESFAESDAAERFGRELLRVGFRPLRSYSSGSSTFSSAVVRASRLKP